MFPFPQTFAAIGAALGVGAASVGAAVIPGVNIALGAVAAYAVVKAGLPAVDWSIRQVESLFDSGATAQAAPQPPTPATVASAPPSEQAPAANVEPLRPAA